MKNSLHKVSLGFSCFRWFAVLSHPARKGTAEVHCLLVFVLLNSSQKTAFQSFPAHFPSSQKTFYCALTEGQWLSLLRHNGELKQEPIAGWADKATSMSKPIKRFVH